MKRSSRIIVASVFFLMVIAIAVLAALLFSPLKSFLPQPALRMSPYSDLTLQESEHFKPVTDSGIMVSVSTSDRRLVFGRDGNIGLTHFVKVLCNLSASLGNKPSNFEDGSFAVTPSGTITVAAAVKALKAFGGDGINPGGLKPADPITREQLAELILPLVADIYIKK